MTDPPGYPRELERDVVLRDGAKVHVRPIGPDDVPRLVAAYARLSAHSAYQRFFSAIRRLPPDWARFLATVDYRTRLALIAERPVDGDMELLGVARYEPTHDDAPEVAFVILDAWQNRGLGTILFHALLEAGAARGFRRFRPGSWPTTCGCSISFTAPATSSSGAVTLLSSSWSSLRARRSAHHQDRQRRVGKPPLATLPSSRRDAMSEVRGCTSQ
jgi:RimJ/RimL family protein N-acetyltransferase